MQKHIGLMKSGNPEFANLWVKICMDGQQEHDEWVKELRRHGVKAAHPDDGWVNRQEHYVNFCYPQFNDDPQVGDTIVLGWPSEPAKNRYLIVTEIRPYPYGPHYYFREKG